MNITYPGLRLLNRDANMHRFAEKYELGQVLFDERPICGSFILGEVMHTGRYAILSNQIDGTENGAFNSEWAVGVLPAGAHFKVLDVYRRLGKVQITLLHLPDEHWQFFEDVSTNVDDLLVEYTRKRFDSCLDGAGAMPALTDERWHKLCTHLIGMTDLGMPFALS